MLLFHAMIKKLIQTRHRTLIFSQMTILLDILEDYLNYESISYERIDGTVSSADRQQRIDKFNDPNSTVFCFLLSTRACRLGINLATADTVIIYDSDWNPHNDIQALSRVHRIGQKNEVIVYRFVTKHSIEEGMLQIARKKLVLDHIVVQKMEHGIGATELQSLIKIGAQQLFAKDEKLDETIVYTEEKLEKLMDRSTAILNQEIEKSKNNDAYISTLNQARVWENVDTSVTQDEEYWKLILSDRLAPNMEDDDTRNFGKGKRIKKE